MSLRAEPRRLVGYSRNLVRIHVRRADRADQLRTYLGRMFSRSREFVNVCGNCRRACQDDSVKNVKDWLARNFDAEVQPKFQMVWVKLEPAV